MVQKKIIPNGSDVSAGKYECNDCGYVISISSTESLPPCPEGNLTEDNPKYVKHVEHSWKCISGVGDAKEDPYPNKK